MFNICANKHSYLGEISDISLDSIIERKGATLFYPTTNDVYIEIRVDENDQTFITKFSENNIEEWKSKLSSNSIPYKVIQTYNSETLVLLENEGDNIPLIIKYDSEGNMLSQYSLPSDRRYLDMVQTSDECFALVGYRYIEGADLNSEKYMSIILDKYDSEFNLIWSKDISYMDWASSFAWIMVMAFEYGYSTPNISTYNNEIVFHWLDVAGTNNKIRKYNLDGDVLWEKNYEVASNHFLSKAHVATSNGDILMFGRQNSSTDESKTEGYVVKYDKNKKKVYERAYEKEEEFTQAIAVNNNVFLFGTSNILYINDKGDVLFEIPIDYKVMPSMMFQTYPIICDNTIILSGINEDTGNTVIAKYNIDYSKNSENNSFGLVDVYLVPKNTLQISLDTNQIIFEDFSYTQDFEKRDILKVKVSSTLPYNLKASVEGDIVGTTHGLILDKSILNMKTSLDNSYKSFSNSDTTLELLSNQPEGNDVVHSIDIKLSTNKMSKIDIYKTVLKFEVEQI